MQINLFYNYYTHISKSILHILISSWETSSGREKIWEGTRNDIQMKPIITDLEIKSQQYSITIPLDQTVSVDGIFDQGHVLSYPVSAPLHSHSPDTSQHTFLPADPQKVSLHHTPNRPQRKPLDIGPLASTSYRKIKELILKQSNAITSALMNLFNYILYWYEIFLRKLNCFAI